MVRRSSSRGLRRLPKLAASAALWLGVFASPGLRAQDKKEPPLSWDRSIRPIVQRHCFKCHNAEVRKGEIDLTRDENPRLIAQNRKVWQTALEVVQAGEMPPKKAPQPKDDERGRLVEFLKKTLGQIECKDDRDPGKPVVRRLNRVEYDACVEDLVGRDLNLADAFSPDASSYGFDTIAEALAVSPVLVEQYHAAANKLLDALQPLPEVAPFATKAFRRPADPEFLAKLKALEAKGGRRAALLAVLISPRFLMRIEQAKPDAKGPYLVDDYDLASRLSFFLWSGPPDAVLLDLAAKGGLRTPEAVEAQARRMLADPRSRALADNFVGQWLQLRGLATHKPDPKVFPGFTETLRTSMRRELELFLGEVIRKDRPLTELIDADFTYLDEELARHYGIDGVTGAEMRRVSLPDRRRGGLLTSAALLMLQSDPDRNNVPRRGNFVAGAILGAPPPPPPPDVPQLEDTKAEPGKELTLRERLELHRSKPDCMGCHSKIDPLGFGLENYDAIGRWRDREAGRPVDASGVLPSGRAFTGPVELKRIILERRDDFARTTAENLLIYALGRGLQLEDECVVRDALKAAAAGEYRFSTLVLTIVKSHPFRYRRNPEY
jgi:hypothetical protein